QRHVRPRYRIHHAALSRLGERADATRLRAAADRQFRAAAAWRDVLGPGFRTRALPQAAEGCLWRALVSAGAVLCARRPGRARRLVAGRWRDTIRDRGPQPRPTRPAATGRFPRRGGVLSE